MSWLLNLVAAVATLVTVLRIEHLFASNVWISRHGAEFIGRLRNKSQSFISDPQKVWPLYVSCKAWNPFLFFGIKSYLLLYWSRQTGSLWTRFRGRLARAVRLLWRYFVFPIVMSIALCVVSVMPGAYSYRWYLLGIALTLNLGSLAIAAESVLAVQKLGTWANWYHRWPERPHKKAERRQTAELKVYVGSALIALVCAFTLITVAGTQFLAFDKFPVPGPAFDWEYVGSVYGIALRSTILSFLTFALNEPLNAIGSLAIIVVGIVEFIYVTFAWTIVSRLW